MRVYVAGAYSADNVMDVLRNIGRGQHYAAKLFMLGYSHFCPWHDKEYVFANWSEEISVGKFYKYSIDWLAVSDIVFVVPGWEKSQGTKAEITKARELNIPVVYSLKELQEWNLMRLKTVEQDSSFPQEQTETSRLAREDMISFQQERLED